MFEKGDKVVSSVGIGEVVRVGFGELSVEVRYENLHLIVSYTEDGRILTRDKFPTLFKLGEQPKSWKVTKKVKKYRVLHRTFRGIKSLKISAGHYESVEDYNLQTGGNTGIQLLVDDQDFEEVEVEL